mgnify:CR=1 FL=1
MALSLGVHKGATGGGPTSAVTTTAGSTIIVAMMANDWDSGNVAPPTDSKGCTWTKVGSEYVAHSYDAYSKAVFYKNEGGARGASHTLTMPVNGTILVQEILGTAPYVDTVTTGVRDTSSPYQSNAYTPAVADEILLALGIPDTTAAPVAYTWGDSFATTGDDVTNQDYWACSLAYRVVSSVTSYIASLAIDGTVTGIGLQVLGVRETLAAAAALTGTATASITEADVRTGGKTIILTLTGDTFIAA